MDEYCWWREIWRLVEKTYWNMALLGIKMTTGFERKKTHTLVHEFQRVLYPRLSLTYLLARVKHIMFFFSFKLYNFHGYAYIWIAFFPAFHFFLENKLTQKVILNVTFNTRYWPRYQKPSLTSFWHLYY